MAYGRIESLKSTPGRRDEVVAILLSGADTLRTAGCRLYLVGVSDADADLIWVNEVWPSRAHHEMSLRLPAAKAAVTWTAPLLTGEYTRHELTIVGGLGVWPPGTGPSQEG